MRDRVLWVMLGTALGAEALVLAMVWGRFAVEVMGW